MLTFHFDLVIMNKNRGVIPEFSRERIRLIMKKTISIVVALAMVFVMSFSAFATGEGEDLAPVKPTDPTELGVYYAELLNAEDSDPAVVAQMILDDLIVGEGDEGVYTVEDLPTVLAAFAENSTDVDKLVAAAEQITAGLESMGVVLPDLDDILPPSGEGDEGNEGGEDLLPDDNEEPGSTDDFLNTILGILGSIGDMIFGGGEETPNEPSDGDDAFPDDNANPDDGDDLISDTGDTTVLSVAAVALVAGAALALTRKKSEDAE